MDSRTYSFSSTITDLTGLSQCFVDPDRVLSEAQLRRQLYLVGKKIAQLKGHLDRLKRRHNATTDASERRFFIDRHTARRRVLARLQAEREALRDDWQNGRYETVETRIAWRSILDDD